MKKIHLNSINFVEETFTFKGGRKVKEVTKRVKVGKFKKDLIN